jgi:hypothetical protein
MENRILSLLKQNDLSFSEILRTNDIKLKIDDSLSSKVLGMVYKTKRQRYVITLNANINHETQKKVFLHEIYHIENHLPELGYVIGIDMQHSNIEKNADIIMSFV